MNAIGGFGQYRGMGAAVEASGDGSGLYSDPSSGDPAVVFAGLFDEHAPGLHRYLSRRIGSAADDLVAETFLAALAGRDGFDRSRADPRAWLYGIATNLLRRHQRQELRGLAATAKACAGELPGSDPGDVVPDQVDARDRVGRLASGIADLSPDDRDVLLLIAWAGLAGNEVAQVLGVPVGTVRSRLHRVRRQLRTHEPSRSGVGEPADAHSGSSDD